MTSVNPTQDTTTNVVGIINFHGLTLWVVHHEGHDYIQAKPLSDLAGLNWRTTKNTLQEGDNAILYATKRLKPPVFVAEGGASTPTPEVLCLRLDRARMFLARINTNQMRSQGNEAAAEMLLNLQIEWAEALHSYETMGVALKNGKTEARRKEEQALSALVKTRNMTKDPHERHALTVMIHDKLTELGYPPTAADDKQIAINL